MRTVVFDIETEAIPKGGHRNIQKIWCIVCQDIETGEVEVFTDEGNLGYKPLEKFKEYADGVDEWVAHNGLSFDVPVVNRLLGIGIETPRVVDTFVVSRLVNYNRYATHSLDELGAALKCRKTPFADWSCLSQEMIDYCIQDVKVNVKIFKHYERFVRDPEWQDSLRLEHDMVVVNEDMSANGFLFNKDMAELLLHDIQVRMKKLRSLMQEAFPPSLEEVNRIKYVVRKDGELGVYTQNAIDTYPKTQLDGSELVCYDYVSFNPGSTKDRIEKLWEAGWNPVEKTKTHNEFTRSAEVGKMWRKTRLTEKLYQEKKEHFEFYGWKVNEFNLSTLPKDAPEGAKRLAEWLTLEGRRSSLTEWLGCVSEDNRIHGKFWNIGAWTHRMSHSAPNQANIFSPFHGEPRNSVEKIKSDYDRDLRALWTTDKVLVGTDASGIQLRILCHYMESEEYRKAILEGSKADGTDIHNLNRRALGLEHLTRDDAKTFIYAFLLGAGIAKIASILRTNTKQAREAMENFYASLPELKQLKSKKIPSDAGRGYFVGLDGRKVLCDSEHLMLAGYLQNGEAVITKRWIVEWRKMATEAGLWFKHVDYVHDEVVCETLTEEDGLRLMEIQRKAMEKVSEDLNLFCPMDIEGDIGKTWVDVH